MPASCRWCRSWDRSAPAATWRRCRTWPSCCWAAAKPSIEGERMPGAEALRRAGLAPIRLSHKEGLALNNGTAQMLATGVLAAAQLEDLLDTADLAAAMTIDAFAGRMRRVRRSTCMRCVRIRARCSRAANLRRLLAGFDPGRHRLPPGAEVPAVAAGKLGHAGRSRRCAFDIGWDWVPLTQRHGREKFLPALPAVPRRQEAPAAGQLFAALHPAGAWRGARCAGAGASACSTSN